MMNKLRAADEARMRFAGGMRSSFASRPWWMRALIVLVAIGVAFSLPFSLQFPVLEYLRTDFYAAGGGWNSVLFTIAVYCLIAVGLNIVVGWAGLLDLGYVGFFAVGAYSVALFGSPNSEVTKWIQRTFGLTEGWALSFAVCVPLAIALTMVSGVLLGWPTLRLRGDYLAIVTMGFGEIIRIIARNSQFTGGARGVTGIPKPSTAEIDGYRIFGSAEFSYMWYYLALTALLVCIFAARRLERSRVGRAWLAIREDEDAAGIMGVSGFKFKLWAFAIGAALGGLSGALLATRQGAIEPQIFDLNKSILFVAFVVVGGSGNIIGVMAGVVVLQYLPELFRGLGFEEGRPLAVGLALVLVMIFRPQGLIPSSRRAAELKDRKKEAEEVAVSG